MTYTEQLEKENERLRSTGLDIIQTYSIEAMQAGTKILDLEYENRSAKELLEDANSLIQILKNYSTDTELSAKVWLLQGRIDSLLNKKDLALCLNN